MTRQIQDAYIVAAVRTPVGKAPRGMFRAVRPDDLLAHVLKGAVAKVPGLDPKEVADVIWFLCSDQSSYISGAEIEVNGAQHV